jgi:rhamnogalacturonan II specific xylosyltransferase
METIRLKCKRNIVIRAVFLIGMSTLCLIVIGYGGKTFSSILFQRQNLTGLSSDFRPQNPTLILNRSKETIMDSNRFNTARVHSKIPEKYMHPKLGDHHVKNWTILLTVNDAYFDFFQNWHFAYRKLNINYTIIIVAEDETVYKKLRPFQSESMTIENSGHEDVNKYAAYGSKEFSKLVSQRPTHILRHLTKGVNILYSDIDMVWLQNPFPYFTGDFDMWIELDSINNYCTGLMAIKSNRNCLRLIKTWQNSLQHKQEIDQTAFNKVVRNATIDISILDNRIFPTGRQYFGKFTDKQRASAVVVHNNWIVGKQAKLNRFQKYKLWFVPV